MSTPVSETAVSLPAPALRHLITGYAGFRASGVPPGTHFGLPSSDVDLIVSLSRPIEVVQMPNSAQRPAAFTALVSGLQDAPAVVRQGGDVFGLHVFIKPLGVRAILAVASAELSSLVVNLSDIWGNGTRDLVDMLLAARTWRERFAILDGAFLAKLNSTPSQPEIACLAKTGERSRICAGSTTRGRNWLEPAALQRPVSRHNWRNAQICRPHFPVRARMPAA